MKGQISLEAVMILGIAVVILVSLVNLNWERLNLAREVGEAGEAKMAGELLATAINNAYANGDGFQVYLDSNYLNYTKLSSTSTEGTGISLPLTVNTSGRIISISKSMSRTGGGVWNTTVSIIPTNVTREAPSAQYPQTTIRNNGTHIIIYATEINIMVI